MLAIWNHVLDEVAEDQAVVPIIHDFDGPWFMNRARQAIQLNEVVDSLSVKAYKWQAAGAPEEVTKDMQHIVGLVRDSKLWNIEEVQRLQDRVAPMEVDRLVAIEQLKEDSQRE
jgi:hypothetical protein